jgi:hypothetical protein
MEIYLALKATALSDFIRKDKLLFLKNEAFASPRLAGNPLSLRINLFIFEERGIRLAPPCGEPH